MREYSNNKILTARFEKEDIILIYDINYDMHVYMYIIIVIKRTCNNAIRIGDSRVHLLWCTVPVDTYIQSHVQITSLNIG